LLLTNFCAIVVGAEEGALDGSADGIRLELGENEGTSDRKSDGIIDGGSVKFIVVSASSKTVELLFASVPPIVV
jgi:hypothetical protein